MLPPETNVNGANTRKDNETFIDSNKAVDTVNKFEPICNDDYECKISNGLYQYINTPIALPCNHDSEFDSLCLSHCMYINNSRGFVIDSCSKTYLPTVNSNLLNHGPVNTCDVCQNVCTQNEVNETIKPCHTKANVVYQDCYNIDSFSKESNCTVTWAHNASNQLTCHSGDLGSPVGDPMGGFAYELGPWGHKHRVDVFYRTYECEVDNVTLIFVHSSPKDDLWGWYYLTVGARGNNLLLDCNCIPQGPLYVSHSTDMYLVGAVDNLEISPNSAYQDYLKNYQMQTYYNMSYTTYMEYIIDTLIGQANCVEPSPSDVVNTALLHDPVVTSSEITREIGSYTSQQECARVNTDNNCHDKSRGFLNHSEAKFAFIGPDKQPVLITDIDQCVKIAKIIQETGKPNYAAARIPLVSDLNLEAWQKYLADYHDEYVLQYLKFGFPLSLSNPTDLNSTSIVNHASALQYPQAIEQYLDKECKAGAMIGPFQKIPDPDFHCSPMLTRPKDNDKRRVIMNLSHPHGVSLNDHVDKKAFDNRSFTLLFSTIDDIVTGILATEDPVIFKIDISRAFRNLRVDPRDVLKFGLKWGDDYYLDLGIAFGWIHGSGSFQMVADAIVHIMAKLGCKVFAYIDDFIGVCTRSKGQHYFKTLYDLITELGLPINPDKVDPPTTELTCLGISISIGNSTLAIDQKKLDEIYQECCLTLELKYLSRQKFQSLLGKLLYIHKCVHPARIFVNRILDLFRANSGKKRIKLTPEFFLDIKWFQKFLPDFNGITFFDKPSLPEQDTLHLDASLTGLGGIWSNRVYSTPVIDIPGFDFKIVHLEMINILVALRLWGKFWKHSTVKIFCDNQAVVQVVATNKTKDPCLAACIRNIWLISAHYDITIQIQHISGKENVEADLLSRIYSDKQVDTQLLHNLQQNYIWDTVPIQYFSLDLQF